MRISKTTFTHNDTNSKSTKTKEIAKTTGIVAGTVSTFIGGFYLKDLFTGQKKYDDTIKNIYNNYTQKVEEKLKLTITKRKEWGENVTEGEIDAIKFHNREYLKRNFLNDELTNAKKFRLSQLRSGFQLSAGIGLAAVPLALMARNYIQKQETNIKQNYLNKTKEITGSVKTIANSIVVSVVGYSLHYLLSGRKKYNEAVSNINKIFNNKVEKSTFADIELAKNCGYELTEKEIIAKKEGSRAYLQKNYLNYELTTLKRNRFWDLRSRFRSAIAVGLAISPFALIVRHYLKNKKNENNSIQPAKTNNATQEIMSFNNSSKIVLSPNRVFKNFGSVSFTGIID